MFDQPASEQPGPAPVTVADQLQAIEHELKALSAVDLHALDPDALAELTIRLAKVHSMAEAQAARAADALRDSPVIAASGARSAKAWLAHRTGQSPQACGRRLRLGKVMRLVPEAGAAWEAGEISADHVSRLGRARNPRTAEQLETDAGRMVELAKELSYSQFDRMVTYWSQLADSDGADRDDAEGRAARSAHLSESLSGMWYGEQTFDPVTGAIVATELRRLEQEHYEADKAEARERLGRDPHPDELARTPAQRRADAWATMAERSAAKPPGAVTPRVLLSVLVGESTFADLCEIELTHRPVPPGALAGLLDRAVFERILFDAPDRVLSVSSQRSFTGLLRRALEVRDRTCTDPGCEVSAVDCQGDHVHPAAAGGPTSEANGQMQCPGHNARKGARPGRRRRADHDRYLRWIQRRPRAGPSPDPDGSPPTERGPSP